MKRHVALGLAMLAGVLLATPSPTAAQEVFPARPVRLVVSFPPGGGVDAVARLFADKMSPLLGQPVVVENRGGASGTIAGKQVASAAPDGYNVLVASNSMLVATVMNPRSGLDIAGELHAIASTAPQAVIVVTRPDIPAASLKELIALARTRALNYGSPGVGSVPHLVIEHLFTAIENARMEHIPFPGAAQALTAALGGQVEVAVVTLPPAVAQVASGQLKGIAVTTPARGAARGADHARGRLSERGGDGVERLLRASQDPEADRRQARRDNPGGRRHAGGQAAARPARLRADQHRGRAVPARRRQRAQELGRDRREGRHQAAVGHPGRGQPLRPDFCSASSQSDNFPDAALACLADFFFGASAAGDGVAPRAASRANRAAFKRTVLARWAAASAS
jgi:tripartite-type tricarboxylate transporter receptor subunit TctC